jgi:uncharacterized protein (DUF305 family)
MKKILYIFIFIFVLLILNNLLNNRNNINNINEKFTNNPCNNNLSDLEYLHHMIPHHQVAVDISVLLQKKTKNPTMQEILRKLIWVQKYEIYLMNIVLNNLPNNISKKINNKHYIPTISDYTKPNELGLTKTYCDPNFFNPKEHMKHLQHMKLDDNMYIKHMIPHHQVAVDMSKKLLKNTKNDFMIYLAYRIIRSQQDEILLLNDLLKENNYKYQSNLIN